jgi:hypothetical protein
MELARAIFIKHPTHQRSFTPGEIPLLFQEEAVVPPLLRGVGPPRPIPLRAATTSTIFLVISSSKRSLEEAGLNVPAEEEPVTKQAASSMSKEELEVLAQLMGVDDVSAMF